MGKKLIFDYMYFDTVSEHVEVDMVSLTVESKVYAKDIMLQVFGKRPKTVENVQFFFRSRCFEETNYGLRDLLKLLGLQQYNPYDIVRITHGKMVNDPCWIRFEGETLSYEELISQSFEERARQGHERIKRMDEEFRKFDKEP